MLFIFSSCSSDVLHYFFFKVPLAETRVTRRARKKLTGNANSPHTDQTVPTKAKRGTRRKAQESSSYMISEYLDREVNFYQRRQILYTWELIHINSTNEWKRFKICYSLYIKF